MDVSSTIWWVTGLLTVGVLLFDVLIIGRRPHEPSMREVAIRLSPYIAAAVVFGIWVSGTSPAASTAGSSSPAG